MDDVEIVSDRVIVINHGQIVFDNSMEELLKKYKDKKYLTITLSEPIANKQIEKYGKVVDHKSLSYTIEISKAKQSHTISQIMEKLPVDDIDIIHVPLEEIIGNMFTSKN